MDVGEVVEAIQVLRGHHSNSNLPDLAERTLTEFQLGVHSEEVLPPALGTMASSKQPWYCTGCWRLNKQTADYCRTCGQHWQMGYTSQTDYQNQSWERPKSPRRRQTPVSPRARKMNATTDGGGQSGKGKGKATKGWQQHVAPSAKTLPQPPKSTAVALPSGAPSTSSTASSAEKNLENLVLALQSSSVELPPGVRDLVRQHSEQSTRMTAQTLHKAVNAQTAARRELRKIKDQRRSYLGSWAHYITTLAETLAKQIAEQEETLNNFQEAEDAWHQQLKAASEDLARLATEKPETSAELEADEMDAEEEEASNAKTVAALASHREQQQRLLETLTQATQNAKALASAQREGSRTPRRRGAQPIPVDSSSEDAPVAPVPGKA